MKTAIISLQTQKSFVTKPADKNMDICIINRADYETEYFLQLHDTSNYQQFTELPNINARWYLLYIILIQYILITVGHSFSKPYKYMLQFKNHKELKPASASFLLFFR